MNEESSGGGPKWPNFKSQRSGQGSVNSWARYVVQVAQFLVVVEGFLLLCFLASKSKSLALPSEPSPKFQH